MFVSKMKQKYYQIDCFTGDVGGLIATRVILGLVQGPMFPCLTAFVVPWYPISERGKLCSIGYVGLSVNNTINPHKSNDK